KLAKKNNLHLQKTDEHVIGYLDARNKHFKILLFQYNVLVLFKTFITAAMLIVGTILLVNQQLNIGQFIAAEIIILLILNSVEKLINNLSSVYDTLTSLEKISSFTEKPIEENGSVQLPENSNGLKIQMINLSFSYNNKTEVLHNISLQINPGDKVCVMGNDGSGKTTLLRLMTGSYTDFKGALLMDDIPVGNYDLASLRSQIGVLINQQDIFQGTIWENISLGNNSISMQSVSEIAVKVGLKDFIDKLRNGYDTMLNPTGKQLPRNVIHKILLVRALTGKPHLLLLEDPWTNLENDNRFQIIQLLNETKNTTLVVVCNDENFAKQCDKVILMKEGSIIIKENGKNI
ncbi:MAG: ABC transporter ATP-binding protein, partial [Flavobacterium sp.]|nr:ABC transporter ATP-binding protein [Pedobacter sp.]